MEFFKSVKQKNQNAAILELKDNHGRSFTKREDLDRICHDFYKKLYQHKEIMEGALLEVFKGFPDMITQAMCEPLMRDITEKELSTVVIDMAKRKAPRHDGIPMNFFQKLWSTIGQDFL